MNRKIYNLLIILFLGILTGCTNNGDIGPCYGLWSLKSITIDGVDTGCDCKPYFWRFQSEIIVISEVLEDDDFVNSFGTWHKDGDTLVLVFTHTNNDGENGFNPPEALLLPGRKVLNMDIINLTSNDMVLSYTNDQGKKQVYTLSKLN